MSAPAVDEATLERLRAELGGDAGVMRELVGSFLVQAPKVLSEATAAAAAGDAPTLHRAVHTLKSTAATFGAATLAELCRDLERDASAGVPPRAVERVAELRREYEAARATLAKWA